MLSHVCARCGTDQARTRAVLDRDYGLWVVCCPGCGRASVRERHPLDRFLRAFRRVDWACTVLAFNMACGALLLGLVLGAAVWISADVAPVIPHGLREEVLLAVAIDLLVLPVLLGAWITVGLGHWRRPDAWMAVIGLLLLGGIVATGAAFIDENERLLLPRTARPPGPPRAPVQLGSTLRIGAALLVSLAIMLAVAPAGVLPGRWLRVLLRAARWRLWCWRRSRRRRGEASR